MYTAVHSHRTRARGRATRATRARSPASHTAHAKSLTRYTVIYRYRIYLHRITLCPARHPRSHHDFTTCSARIMRIDLCTLRLCHTHPERASARNCRSSGGVRRGSYIAKAGRAGAHDDSDGHDAARGSRHALHENLHCVHASGSVMSRIGDLAHRAEARSVARARPSHAPHSE